METKLIPAAGFQLRTLKVKGFPRKISTEAVQAVWQLARSLSEAGISVNSFNPDVAVGMGGFASVPALLRSWLRGVPVVIHEQNSFPGRANRLLARISKVIAVTFPESERYFTEREKVVWVGNPIRKKIQRVERVTAASRLGIDHSMPTVLVLGGSRGAKKINEAIGEIVTAAMNDFQIVHLTGETNFVDFQKYQNRLYKPIAYIDDIQYAHSVADLVVCRAGASTISEIAYLGIPAVLIPYPYATDDHQLRNAQSLEKKGAAVIILDNELTGEKLSENIYSILYNDERLKAMVESMRGFSAPEAAKRLKELVLEVGKRKL